MDPKAVLSITQNKILHVHAILTPQTFLTQSHTSVILFYFCKAYSVLPPGIAELVPTEGVLRVSFFAYMHILLWAERAGPVAWEAASEVLQQ